MSVISKRVNSKGEVAFRVSIRKKGKEIYKTFHSEEDAKLYSWWKESLIENMENFDIPIKSRVTLEDLLELKINDAEDLSPRSKIDIPFSVKRIIGFVGQKRFVSDISYEEWKNIMEKLSGTTVYRGTKSEVNGRSMSVSTLRRIFACLSSVFSHAISKGIDVENHPLKVMQLLINPMMKNEKT